MKIYTLESHGYDGGTEYFTTLNAAIKRGRALKRDGQEEVEIECCTVVKLDKEALIDILRSRGGEWCAHNEIVKVL